MKKHFSYAVLLTVMAVVASGCSTKKNTWVSRNYQAMNTRFNVYFNGSESYKEGLKNIQKANQDDYSLIIPMYPVSKHSNASAAKGDMDRTIEKCRKAIKLHSIKVKPAKNYKKINNPDYKLFYNQDEFNPALSDAWLLLAKAEFHKGDFLGSTGTFSYIARHYNANKDIVVTCQLWIARAYGEMGWIYEAEEVLSKLNQDDLRGPNVGLFSAVNADLLLKKRQYKEAIPFLELALSKEKEKDMRMRFGFLLAQLYQKTGNKKAAYDAYTKVIKQNPPYEMDVNARINSAQLTDNVQKVRKELRAMLKNKNNKEYCDQIFYALGNTYLSHGDTLRAIENYRLSADTSSRRGVDKAITLITLGDLYYLKRNYVQAQPCYDEASKIITNEHEDFARVSKRAETLGELVTQNEIVVLQDSLQKLATMSEEQRLKVVRNVIAQVVADEKRAAEKALKENEARTRGEETEPDMALPIGLNAQGGWYFYNPQIIRSGSAEFTKKWGRRKLEDNWRRSSKASSMFGEESNQAETATPGAAAVDTTGGNSGSNAEVADNKKPEFYLRQIPVSPAQLAKSNEEVATALYTMGVIYKDKIEDYPMALNTFADFINRFGSDKRVPDAYFNLYLIHTRLGNQADADRYRAKLVNDFPGTKYHQILSQPDYLERLERMSREQDSLYTLTYKAYNASDFETVFQNVAYIQKNYPLATLMPKFVFLNALSIGKKESQEKFRTALTELVTKYPSSDVSAMAKDILALMKQGQEAKPGTTGGALLARRDEKEKTVTEAVELKNMNFSTDKHEKHRLLLICKASQDELNKLQYNVAAFNFSRFMIKDFDLVINKLDTARSAVSVTNFESYDEVEWYLTSISSDQALSKLFDDLKVQKVIISEINFGLLRSTYTLDDYLAFMAKPVAVAVNGQPSSTKKNGTPAVAKELVAKATVEPTVKPEAMKTGAKVEKTPVKAETVVPGTKGSTKPSETKVQEEVKPAVSQAEKTVQKPVEEKGKAVQAGKPETKPLTAETKAGTETAAKAGAATPAVTPPKQEEVPLYKGLFGYQANQPHYIALYVMGGTVEFDKLKAAFDTYNKQNYPVMNLKVSLEKVDKLQVILVGSFADASVAKSYLLRMVKERSLFEGLKGATYRNLIGTQKNLNTMVQQNALNTYLEFMKEFYLK